MSKKLELNFTSYAVGGIAEIRLWGGGTATIDMAKYYLDDLDNEQELIDGINDNGFGCESIIGAQVELYENYEGRLVYLESRYYKNQGGSWTRVE